MHRTVTLNLLCAGAAQGLVRALEPAFTAATGAVLNARFGAVGAMQEALLHLSAAIGPQQSTVPREALHAPFPEAEPEAVPEADACAAAFAAWDTATPAQRRAPLYNLATAG